MPPNRRERLRDATLIEIKEAARQHLRTEGPAGISLRGIARAIGMTAPALYRYYEGLGDLHAAMIEAYTNEVSDAMEAARDALPEDDVAGRLVAVTRVFRRWALDNRPEFGMVFGEPAPGYAPPAMGDAEAAGARFGGIFFALFIELWHRRPFPVPADEEIPEALRTQLRAFGSLCGLDDTGLPLGVIRLYAAAWVRLYGLVTMEVFGHVKFLLDDAEALFEAELADLAKTLGVTLESP